MYIVYDVHAVGGDWAAAAAAAEDRRTWGGVPDGGGGRVKGKSISTSMSDVPS